MHVTRSFVFSILGLLVGACSHDYHNSSEDQRLYQEHQAEPSVAIVVHSDDCTGCADALVDINTLQVPASLKTTIGDTLNYDALVLVGQFPHDLLDNSNFSYHHTFQVTGKLIGAREYSGVGQVPVFYVEQWEEAPDVSWN